MARRANGEGSIYKGAAGRWCVAVVLNLLFLIEHGDDGDYANFVEASLAYDKRLLDNIEQRREQEGRTDQEPWEIEKRMRLKEIHDWQTAGQERHSTAAGEFSPPTESTTG